MGAEAGAIREHAAQVDFFLRGFGAFVQVLGERLCGASVVSRAFRAKDKGRGGAWLLQLLFAQSISPRQRQHGVACG